MGKQDRFSRDQVNGKPSFYHPWAPCHKHLWTVTSACTVFSCADLCYNMQRHYHIRTRDQLTTEDGSANVCRTWAHRAPHSCWCSLRSHSNRGTVLYTHAAKGCIYQQQVFCAAICRQPVKMNRWLHGSPSVYLFRPMNSSERSASNHSPLQRCTKQCAHVNEA